MTEKSLKVKFIGDATSLQRTFKQSATGASSLQKQVKGLGTTIGAVFTAGAIIRFGASAVASYKEHEAALAQLQNVMRNTPRLSDVTAKSLEDQATALQNLTGYQDEEVLKADAVLGKFGLTGQQLKEITPLVLDYARATGTDAVTAATNIGRALEGNTRALKAVGISYTSTHDKAKDLANIEDLLKQKVGGAADAFGKTTQGKIDIAKAKYDDLKESVGQLISKAMVPLVNIGIKVLDFFNGLPGPIKDGAVAVAGLVFAGAALGGLVKVLRGGLEGLGIDFGKAAGAAEADTVALGENAAASADAAAAHVGLAASIRGMLLPLSLLVAEGWNAVDVFKKSRDAGEGMRVSLTRAAASAGPFSGVVDMLLGKVKQNTAATYDNSAALKSMGGDARYAFDHLTTLRQSADALTHSLKAIGPAADDSARSIQHNWDGSITLFRTAKGEVAAILAGLRAIVSTEALTTPIFGQPNYHAAGTPFAPPGWSWVGERGPELRYLRGGERILSNAQSMDLVRRSAMVGSGSGGGGGGGDLYVTVNVAGSVLSEENLADAVHKALLKKIRRSGSLGLR